MTHLEEGRPFRGRGASSLTCAGGGTRTHTLFRAPAPKAGVSAISPRPQAPRSYRGRNTDSGYGRGVTMPRRRRFALILLVIGAAAGCLALGWWQWTRFESNSGSFQNLGYALQWPMFAVFCVYAYRKFVRYEETPTGAAGCRVGH